MPAKADLIGQRFGKLLIRKRLGRMGESHAIHWECLCDCGSSSVVKTGNLMNGSTTSCECWRASRITADNLTHGQYNSPTYRSWKSMLARVKDPRYQYHKGRGITVCERWTKFENFLTDMGERPPGTTLDRSDNDGNYEPGNCRWATSKQQARNRRRPRKRGPDVVLS